MTIFIPHITVKLKGDWIGQTHKRQRIVQVFQKYDIQSVYCWQWCLMQASVDSQFKTRKTMKGVVLLKCHSQIDNDRIRKQVTLMLLC